MNEKSIRALVEAGVVQNVLVIADGALIHLDIMTQKGSITAIDEFCREIRVTTKHKVGR